MYVCAPLAYSPDLHVRLFHVSSAPMFEHDCFTLALYTLALGISITPVSETSVPLNRDSKLHAVACTIATLKCPMYVICTLLVHSAMPCCLTHALYWRGCLLVTLCLHALHIYIYGKCSGDTPHLLFTLLTTSRLDTSLYCLLPSYVSICNVVDYID